MPSSTPTKTATKYDGFLSKRTAPAESEPSEKPAPPTLAAAIASPETPASGKKKKDKKLAKTKDKTKKGYTLLLDIDTHTDANFILKKQRTGVDLSDLTQKLLAAWVKENQPKRS